MFLFVKTMLASVVTNCLAAKVASAAYLELQVARDLFERTAPYGGRAKNFLVRCRFRLPDVMFSLA